MIFVELKLDGMKINTGRFLNIMAVVVAMFFLFMWLDSCSGRKNDKSTYEQNEAAYRDSVKNIKNELGGFSATKLTLQLSNDDLKKKLAETAKKGTQAEKELALLTKKFNKLVAAGSFEGKATYDTIEITHTDPSWKELPEFKPKRDTINAPYFNAYLFTTKEKTIITDLHIPTSGHIVFGYKQNGLFNKDEARMELTFGNPHIEVTKATGTIVIIETPWYKKWWVWLITGLTGGFIGKMVI